jgi:hypothetical protein
VPKKSKKEFEETLMLSTDKRETMPEAPIINVTEDSEDPFQDFELGFHTAKSPGRQTEVSPTRILGVPESQMFNTQLRTVLRLRRKTTNAGVGQMPISNGP